ncbi:uncharacterized protein LOC129585483 [Paramacrobiotus metropolitanus]|uniref:uncharacterized protein LOC129585483 n=1 Tax=Paramacrobiotus metropolitanus TaxID=2943436 RepID=UPI0024461652|nr:uncharacterized protein LOC129585483 [Paramacrobiotus metropolitanus]
MKHVRFAKGAEESNLLVFARGPEIVFVTKKAIQPKEELTVWYSEQYNEAVTAPASAALNLRSDPGKKADKMTSTDEDTEEPSSAAKRKADGYDITTQNVYIPVISAEFGPSVPVGIEDGFGYVEEVVVEPVRGRPDPAPAVKNSVSPQKESSKENRLNSSAVIQPSPSNIGSGGGGNLTSGADVENTAKTRERANKCLFCNTSFEDRRKLNIHVIMHGGRDGFRCGVCEEKFAYYGLLAAHFKKHGSEEIATSSLQILTAAAAASSSPTKKKRLSKQDSLDMHFLSHATGSVCTCDECTKPAKSPERNGSHRNSSTSSGRKTHELLNNLFSEYPEDVEDEADLSMSDLEGEYSDSDGFDDSLFEDQEMEDDSAQWQHHKLAGFHKGNKSGGNHLWEFIRDLLKDPRCNPTIIRWDDKKAGIFRIVKSKAVADKWGARKCNPRMNYEKLSRAMRHYYKTEFILPVLGRRLVYKFGPKATGWQD